MKLNITSICEDKNISTNTYISNQKDSQNSSGIFPEKRIRIKSQENYLHRYIQDKDFLIIKYPKLQNDL